MIFVIISSGFKIKNGITMIDPVSTAASPFLIFSTEEDKREVSNIVRIADTKDSMALSESISSGFSYIKIFVVSTFAIIFFSIVGFFVKHFSKDEDLQADVDAKVELNRNKLKETKKSKTPSEV